MTVTLTLKLEVEARLQAQAQAEGMPVEQYLQQMVERLLMSVPLEEAVALYASQKVTQGQAAAMAGMSRAEFITALGKAGVPVFQYDDPDGLIEEILCA